MLENDHAAESDEREPSISEEVNEALAAMLPWATSILLHLSVVLLTLFVVWSVTGAEAPEKIIVPVTGFSEHPGTESLTTIDGRPEDWPTTVRTVTSESISGASAESVMYTLQGGGGDASDLLHLIGKGGGGGAGGNLAPLGTVGVGSIGRGLFPGENVGNAKRVAYVIDASGSLIDTMPFVLRELRRSIDSLSEQQQFTVIFFGAGTATELPPRGWKAATDSVKSDAAAWISDPAHVVPHGSTDPTPALHLAMAYRPDLMFILSDDITGRGRYEIDRDRLLQTLSHANPQHRTVINTIQFLEPDPLNTLREVAKQNGPGLFRFVSQADLLLNH